MTQSMVTGRMDEAKKAAAARILSREGLNSSAAINLLFDRIIDEGNVDFLKDCSQERTEQDWKLAFSFVDSLSEKRSTRFDNMTKAEIKAERLKQRGLM